mmetsp:Transcript_6168/g.19210  ORF Transcript_6168/g.19210 Transcript_6168/m.19210 type:complete len:208 (-) Transcript_6168:2858-3481(-)
MGPAVFQHHKLTCCHNKEVRAVRVSLAHNLVAILEFVDLHGLHKHLHSLLAELLEEGELVQGSHGQLRVLCHSGHQVLFEVLLWAGGGALSQGRLRRRCCRIARAVHQDDPVFPGLALRVEPHALRDLPLDAGLQARLLQDQAVRNGGEGAAGLRALRGAALLRAPAPALSGLAARRRQGAGRVQAQVRGGEEGRAHAGAGVPGAAA